MSPEQYLAGALICLVGALLVGGVAVRLRANRNSVEQMAVSTCAQVSLAMDDVVRARVRVAGAAEPYADGLLTAPLSGEPCVWWETKITRATRGGVVTGEAGPLPYGNVDAVHRTSGAPFAIRDGSGRVLVDPREALVHGGTVSYDDAKPPPGHREADGGAASGEYLERSIAPGVALYVVGEARRSQDGPIIAAPEPGDDFLISTQGAQGHRDTLRDLQWTFTAATAVAVALAVFFAVQAVLA